MKTCPRLYLAPMEGVGDRPFRSAMGQVGGFDEASTSFLRVPLNAHVKSLAKAYSPDETAPIPLTAQIMGFDPELCAAMAVELEGRGAPRIDLNCGCPSNRVTGRGAGSSLLKDPSQIAVIVKAMKGAVGVPVSVKIRSGFDDTTLYEEVLLAVEEGGADLITIHPRTKREGYTPPARWDLIALAVEKMSIPVVGSGDVKTPADVERMVRETQCHGVMIGRGALADPWIFHRVRAFYKGEELEVGAEEYAQFLRKYYQALKEETRCHNLINKLKQIARYLFPQKRELLRQRPESATEFLEELVASLACKEGASGIDSCSLRLS